MKPVTAREMNPGRSCGASRERFPGMQRRLNPAASGGISAVQCLAVMMKTVTPLLACLLALAGCAVGPDYVKPTATLAPLRNVNAVEARAAGPAAPRLDQWWTGFGDPRLTGIIERVLNQNLDLKASMERIAQSRAVARAWRAQLLPAFDANAQVIAERQSLESPIGAIAQAFPGFDRNAELYDIGIGASWEIDLFGGLLRHEEAAKAEAGAAEAMHAGIRVAVMAEAADSYFRIRGDQAQLRVVEAQIATDAELLELIRLRNVHGMATDREVAQAEALLAQAQGNVPLLRIDLEAQLNRLDVLMGAQPGTSAGELAASAALPAVPQIATKTSELLRRRPDVIAAERNLAAANARIGAAVAEYYPKLSLAGLLGFESLTPDHLFRRATFQPVGVAGLRWRLFDFGRINAEVAHAHAATREALVRYRQAILSAAEDVETACATLVQLELRLQDITRHIGALTRARDESREAYQAGLIALTDVLVADRQLLVAKSDLPRTQADAARAAVRLFRALGGGW